MNDLVFQPWLCCYLQNGNNGDLVGSLQRLNDWKYIYHHLTNSKYRLCGTYFCFLGTGLLGSIKCSSSLVEPQRRQRQATNSCTAVWEVYVSSTSKISVCIRITWEACLKKKKWRFWFSRSRARSESAFFFFFFLQAPRGSWWLWSKDPDSGSRNLEECLQCNRDNKSHSRSWLFTSKFLPCGC